MRNLVLIPLLLLCAVARPADAPAKPARLGLCMACHGETGVGIGAGIPTLAAQDETYLATALKQYRSGERTAPAMRAMAGALSDEDIAALARWYAAQPPRGRNP